MHARDGAEDEHVDGLTQVSRAEDADGLQRGGVVVGEVANELLGEESGADGTLHQLGAVVVEAGSVPDLAVATRADCVGDVLQLATLRPCFLNASWISLGLGAFTPRSTFQYLAEDLGVTVVAAKHEPIGPAVSPSSAKERFLTSWWSGSCSASTTRGLTARRFIGLKLNPRAEDGEMGYVCDLSQKWIAPRFAPRFQAAGNEI